MTAAPMSTDRVTVLRGSMETLIPTIREMFNLVFDFSIHGVNQPYDPVNFDRHSADEYGGFGHDANVGEGGVRQVSVL